MTQAGKSLLLLLLLATACTSTPTAAPTLTPSPAAAEVIAPIASAPTRAAPTPFRLPHEGIPTATLPVPPATPTARAYTTRISSVDGMAQVFVPAGTLHMGGLDVYAENDELPYHDVSLGEFWIDQIEVTNGMYASCVQGGGCSAPLKLSSDRRPDYFTNPEFKDYPVTQVTWAGAQAYCTWAGRRLPTEAEWERAARGDDMRTYPWGDEPPDWRTANFNNLVRETTRAGSYPAGASPFGALDMAGNVWEWAADFYDPNYYKVSEEANPAGPAQKIGKYQRVIKGGSYQDEFIGVRLSNRGYELGPNPLAAYGTVELTGRASAKIGFRCAGE
jgi:serine/threonine-protein kinase